MYYFIFHAQEIRQFIRSENSYIRRKQRKLAAERERWRSLYHSSRDTDTDAVRAAKKVLQMQNILCFILRNAYHSFLFYTKTSRDALNKRAEGINRMVDQIRKVQGWLEARESKLIRLESMATSVGRLHNNGEPSLLDHMKTLNALNYELEADLTSFHDEDFESAPRLPVVFGPRSSEVVFAPPAAPNPVGYASIPDSATSIGLTPKLHASAIYGTRLGQSYTYRGGEPAINNLKPLENHSEWLEKMKRDISSFQPQLSEIPRSSEFLAHTNLLFSKKENQPTQNEMFGVKFKAGESEQKRPTFKV
jgi:hypothetical protein